MKNLILLTFVIFLVGCKQEPTGLKFFQVDKTDFDHVINQLDHPPKVDLAEYKTILNRDYPIEIALFKDGTWYYDLPNLDDGSGTWEYEGGSLKLHAKRFLFDMEINLVALSEKAKSIGLEFSDRFGYKLLNTEKINLEE